MDIPEATVVKYQLNNMKVVKGPLDVLTQIEALEWDIQRFNTMSGDHMSQGEMHSLLSCRTRGRHSERNSCCGRR